MSMTHGKSEVSCINKIYSRPPLIKSFFNIKFLPTCTYTPMSSYSTPVKAKTKSTCVSTNIFEEKKKECVHRT